MDLQNEMSVIEEDGEKRGEKATEQTDFFTPRNDTVYTPILLKELEQFGAESTEIGKDDGPKRRPGRPRNADRLKPLDKTQKKLNFDNGEAQEQKKRKDVTPIERQTEEQKKQRRESSNSLNEYEKKLMEEQLNSSRIQRTPTKKIITQEEEKVEEKDDEEEISLIEFNDEKKEEGGRKNQETGEEENKQKKKKEKMGNTSEEVTMREKNDKREERTDQEEWKEKQDERGRIYEEIETSRKIYREKVEELRKINEKAIEKIQRFDEKFDRLERKNKAVEKKLEKLNQKVETIKVRECMECKNIRELLVEYKRRLEEVEANTFRSGKGNASGREERKNENKQNDHNRQREKEQHTESRESNRWRKTDWNARIDEGRRRQREQRTEEQREARKWEEWEREKLRRNIVISGVNTEARIGKEDVEDWLEEKVGAKVKVVKIWFTRGEFKKIGVELSSIEEKQEIMENKSRLKGTTYYINNDTTYKERRNRQELVKKAIELRKEGKEVKVGYGKLTIDGEEFIYDEWKNKFFRKKHWRNTDEQEEMDQENIE